MSEQISGTVTARNEQNAIESAVSPGRVRFADQSMTLAELSFLLWATQGVNGGRPWLRTSPSGGARHPFETILAVWIVEGLECAAVPTCSNISSVPRSRREGMWRKNANQKKRTKYDGNVRNFEPNCVRLLANPVVCVIVQIST